MNAEWLSHIGDFGYNLLLKVNWILNLSRRIFGQGHWSLSAYIKAKVKSAVNFISTYEESVARYARQHGARGIVCGHIHTPAIRRFQDIEYYNTGDWVESCTALVEHHDGSMELLTCRNNQVVKVSAVSNVVEFRADPTQASA